METVSGQQMAARERSKTYAKMRETCERRGFLDSCVWSTLMAEEEQTAAEGDRKSGEVGAWRGYIRTGVGESEGAIEVPRVRLPNF